MKAALAPMLDRYKHLWPRWLEHLQIMFSLGNEERPFMAITMEYQHRRGTLWLYPNWLNQSTERRANILLHEIAHMVTHPYQNAVNFVLHELVEGDNDKSPHYRLAKEMLDDALEAAVSDIATLFKALTDRPS